MTKRNEEPCEFFNALWGQADPGTGHILIWRKSGDRKISDWFEGPEGAAEFVSEIAGEVDVYTGVGLSHSALGPSKRCPSDEIAAISGFWADIDFGAEGHEKKRLPPTEEKALEIIQATGMKPTLLVHSGHGFQAWWLFSEIVRFENSDERADVQELSRGWHRYIRKVAQSLGFDADSTPDLARVLRVPGTVNRKREPHVPVRIVHAGGPRYELEDFRGRVGECPASDSAQAPATSPAAVVLDSKTITADASPNWDRFQQLLDIDAKFRGSWEHARRDLDDSSSGYEMSLASLAARAGWSDDEIAKLIVAHRRKWEPARVEKALRADYLKRTIENARRGIEDGKSDTELANEIVASVAPDSKKEILTELGVIFGGLELDAILKVGRDEPVYYLSVKGDGLVYVGPTTVITSALRFRNFIVSRFNRLPQRMKDTQWDTVVAKILHVQELREDLEGDRPVFARGLIGAYLRESVPQADNWQAMHLAGEPFVREGRVYLQVTSLRQFARTDMLESLTRGQTRALLREAGFEPERIQVRHKESNVTRCCWSASEEWDSM